MQCGNFSDREQVPMYEHVREKQKRLCIYTSLLMYNTRTQHTHTHTHVILDVL
jgi:hypothetical protein